MQKNKGFFFPAKVLSNRLPTQFHRHDILVCILFEYAPTPYHNYKVSVLAMGERRVSHIDTWEVPTKEDAAFYLNLFFPDIFAYTKNST